MDKSKIEQVPRKRGQNKKEWRKFGIGLAFIFCLTGTLQLILGKESYPYFYFGAITVFLASLICPALIRPFFVLFSYIGVGLGWFATKLLLLSLFCFLFTPLGFLLKMAGKDFLDLKLDKTRDTYWKKRKIIKFDKKSYENQF